MPGYGPDPASQVLHNHAHVAFHSNRNAFVSLDDRQKKAPFHMVWVSVLVQYDLRRDKHSNNCM